ncbi:MAG TPA: hypothetical protein VMH80_06620 [Bryobacteraceae bacterium]|nr:hypothetical protein [Bryobacteraceae bacterium]
MKLLVALLLILPAAGQNRFEQFDRDLAHAAAELHASDLRAQVSERGRVVWKRGAVDVPVRTVSVVTQEFEGQRIEWWFQANCLRMDLTAKGLIVCADSKSLTDAPRLEDGNILRSSIALGFIKDVVGLPVSDREELIAGAFAALYLGDRTSSAALVHQALDQFPELESTPDVTLLYLFSHLGLPETEASATAVIREHPSLPTAWFYYGTYLENDKRYREAAACFRMIVDHQPPWHNWTVAAAKKELAGLP